jgi:multidrug efflux pump subunit AcrB
MRTVIVVYDQGDKVTKDLSDLVTTGVETVILVILCLLFTIGWRESLVAALSIPLSFVIAFIGLYASGNTINFISLFSLILAVGILVDSGIVITEAIHTRLQKFGNADSCCQDFQPGQHKLWSYHHELKYRHQLFSNLVLYLWPV